jgi:putative membrane-bound dehydrogenase-like protein
VTITPRRRPAAVGIVVLTGLAAMATLAARAPQGAQAWPPPLHGAPKDSPVLSPVDAMKTFFLPPGYRVELVASEPMIQEPVLVDFDPEGRLWVVEMLGYMPDIAATGEREPVGRISVLEDLNDDGKIEERVDRKTVFLDRLVLPRALKVLDRGVLVAEPPNLWLARDTNGDLRADSKALVTNTYGRLEANVEHNANSLLWALDNWMHTSETDVYVRLKNGAFEVRKTLSRGQWGASQDDAGRIFRNSNESVLHVDLVPTPYFARNPNLLRTRGSYESLRGDSNEVNVVWPVRQTPGVNRGYQAGVLRPDGRLATYTAVTAPTVYRGDRLPSELRGNVFVADPAANVVSRIVVSDDGTRIVARKAYDQAEFLSSTDERFRPVYLSNAPDGTLYVVDMYRGIIQHRDYITEYLRDQILSRKLETPVGHGRIYRVVHESTRRAPKPALSRQSPARLAELLGHPNGWWRDTAQRLLVERGESSVVGALKKAASSAPEPSTRLHALWTLDGLDRIEPADVMRALADASRDVRVSAIRISERWLSQPDHPVQAAVQKAATDGDWAVRRQLAASLGAMPGGVRETALAGLLERHGTDPVVVDAALSGLRGSEPAVLGLLAERDAESPALTASIAMATATIVRSAEDGPIQEVFSLLAQAGRPGWQRSALMQGAEVALFGAAMPGGGGRGGRGAGGRGGGGRGGTAPGALAEPGTRGGPGGAAAFPRPAGAGRGQTTMTAMPLLREPALVGVARENGDLGQRATALLARVTWPGKPNAGPAVAPLTPAEQQRLAAGREVYQTLCIACHQPDGRGREQLAPSLVGSEFALGPAEIAVRIVINGKEGSTGLMPPLGVSLTDDQIAAALTFIRREWGHTASAVDPATVKGVRALTTGRTRPWTAEELGRLRSQQF